MWWQPAASDCGTLSITPTPPAWASINDVPTGIPGTRPSSWKFQPIRSIKNQPRQRSLLHQTEPISIDGGRLFIFPTKQCMLALLVNLRKHQFKLQNNAKVLAFAAVGVRPEPKGWPGKATLRPVIMIHYQVKQWEDRTSNEWHKYRWIIISLLTPVFIRSTDQAWEKTRILQ